MVFCKNCRWCKQVDPRTDIVGLMISDPVLTPGCMSPGNIETRYNWYESYRVRKQGPNELNKNNDCSMYEEIPEPKKEGWVDHIIRIVER